MSGIDWPTVYLVVQAAFSAFHLSVTACIVYKQARKTSTFLSTFFVLYVLQSSSDVVSYALVSSSTEHDPSNNSLTLAKRFHAIGAQRIRLRGTFCSRRQHCGLLHGIRRILPAAGACGDRCEPLHGIRRYQGRRKCPDRISVDPLVK